ncbi:unnamed protein product [Thelazia callipaeda]|uniref:Translation initiation factor eIF2B subunit beta n=1 Tax=Thelazia callipaeda TaxID=103827 RepID=A0A158RB85_THECL|nr:unnamed protein product [Thelazia callipaeda]
MDFTEDDDEVHEDKQEIARRIFIHQQRIRDLINLLETERKLIEQMLPYQFVVSNIILCIIKIVEEENGRTSSRYGNLELWKPSASNKKILNPRELRRSVLAAVSELATEIDTCIENISAQAKDHICTTDVIITHALSLSSTLTAFFNTARKIHKSFRLLVVDEETDFADYLLSVDILTAMQRATRVFIAAVVVFPDGSCLAPAGCLMMCLAAKRHGVPVCVCASFYKFAPFFVSDVDRVQCFGCAANVLPLVEAEDMEDAQIVNPMYDLIPGELILQYISPTSTFMPSHVYRFMADYYHRDRLAYRSLLMAEPGDAVRVDDVENSSGYDEEEEDDDESCSGSDESTSDESCSEDESEQQSSEEDENDDINVWDFSDDGAQTEEAVFMIFQNIKMPYVNDAKGLKEASLQTDYTKALNLVLSGQKQKALRMMEKLLQHPILVKFEVNINLFNWDEAREQDRQNHSRVSAMARLFSSLHFNIGRLLNDPIEHFLSALTVYPNDDYLWKSVGDECLKAKDWPMALFAFRNCSSNMIVIRGILIALYNSNLFEDCLLKIKSVLERDKTYFLGRVLKEIIRETNSFWEMKCRQIFGEDSVYVSDESCSKITTNDKKLVLKEITKTENFIVSFEPVLKQVVIDLSLCLSLVEIGIHFCDLYDRIEAFSSFSTQTIMVSGGQTVGELEKIFRGFSDDLMDCIDVVQDIICKISLLNTVIQEFNFHGITRIQKQLDPCLDWRRRSVRFRAEFNVDDSEGSNDEKLLINSLLNYSCVRKPTIVPLISIKPTPLPSLSPSKKIALLTSVSDGILVLKCVICLTNKFANGNGRIFDILETLLFWYSKNCFYIEITDRLREVIIGCYARWVTNFGNASMIRGDEFLPIHAMLAEFGSTEALFVCYSSLSDCSEHEMKARMLWLIAINGRDTFSPHVCTNHLWKLLAVLKSGDDPEVKYQSLITGHEIISIETVQTLIAQIERKESFEAIQRFFKERQFDKVIGIIIDFLNWNDVDRSALLSTALILIDSYIELNDMENASIWSCRLLDFTGGLAGTEKVIMRVKRIVIENISSESISNLVHCIVPLLVLGGYESDTDLWLILYHCAFRLEGELTAKALSSLYEDGCQMLTSALNVLVTAHEKIAKHDKCYIDDHSFPLFVLNEFSKIRTHHAVIETLSSREYVEQNRAFIDEVHQCLFCLYGCPSRRKRQLEEHGGSHNHEPCLKDIENVLLLLLPTKVPPYDGSYSTDLIEFVQKKASSFLEPTSDEKAKLLALDHFIVQAKISTDWPRCMESSRLRSGVFYQLALHSYRNHKVDDAVYYAKLFLITAPTEQCIQVFFWDWTVLALAATTVFFTVKDEMFKHFDASVFAFRMALFFDPSDRYVIFNFGSALYQINSRIRRYRDKLAVDDIRYQLADRRINGLLEESRRQFEICIPLLSDGDVDKWRCHYFLAKISEKCGDAIEFVFHHYHQSAVQLKAAGIQYPNRINTKKQEHAEAIEIHYRAYASLTKYLLERQTEWSREDLLLMQSFALCFRSHGVCKQKDGDEFTQCPQVKATLIHLIDNARESNDPIQDLMEDLVERIALKTEILLSCEEAFKICILRFPHFKSYYRLSQLALYRGDILEAFNYLFGRFLLKKKANFNPDNIFESVVSISCKDIDRGDALQYHLSRLAALAINIAASLNDFDALITIIHTFCTLDFCNNTSFNVFVLSDYLMKRDLIMLYRKALIKLYSCIRYKIKNQAVNSHLLCSIYDLYQYAERNNAERLCKRLQPVIASAVKEFPDYDVKTEPISFCKQLYIGSKKRAGKRKTSGNPTSQTKSARITYSPNPYSAT